ncbi:hypothetical protein KRP22_003716 [Phytophthora ramorum]|nr:hypothetical protein KRP22_9649 [Phytophthora ramorum]
MKDLGEFQQRVRQTEDSRDVGRTREWLEEVTSTLFNSCKEVFRNQTVVVDYIFGGKYWLGDKRAIRISDIKFNRKEILLSTRFSQAGERANKALEAGTELLRAYCRSWPLDTCVLRQWQGAHRIG